MIYAYIGAFVLILTGVVLGAIALGLIAGAPAVLGFLGIVSVVGGAWLGIAATRVERPVVEVTQ